MYIQKQMAKKQLNEASSSSSCSEERDSFNSDYSPGIFQRSKTSFMGTQSRKKRIRLSTIVNQCTGIEKEAAVQPNKTFYFQFQKVNKSSDKLLQDIVF